MDSLNKKMKNIKDLALEFRINQLKRKREEEDHSSKRICYDELQKHKLTNIGISKFEEFGKINLEHNIITYIEDSIDNFLKLYTDTKKKEEKSPIEDPEKNSKPDKEEANIDKLNQYFIYSYNDSNSNDSNTEKSDVKPISISKTKKNVYLGENIEETDYSSNIDIHLIRKITKTCGIKSFYLYCCQLFRKTNLPIIFNEISYDSGEIYLDLSEYLIIENNSLNGLSLFDFLKF